MRSKTLLLGALLALTGSAQAQTMSLEEDALTLKQGATGQVKVDFEEENGDYANFQFTVKMPQGVSLSKAVFSDLRNPDGGSHGITIGAPNANNEQILMCASMNNDAIVPDPDGESTLLVTLSLTAAVDAEVGTSTVTISNIVFANPDGGRLEPNDLSMSLTVEEGTLVTLDEASAVAPTAQDDVNVLLKRTIHAGGWNTLVLPFALTNAQVKELFGSNTKVATFNSVTTDADENITLKFNNYTSTLKANTPYLVWPEESGDTYTIGGVNIAPAQPIVTKGNVQFIGTYVGGSKVPEGDYYLSENKIYQSAGLSTIGGYRAYFHVKSSDEARCLTLDIDGETTAIWSVKADSNSEDNAEAYDLSGRKAENPAKGIYVKKGQKVIIK